MVDIHSHILPWLDDGASGLEEALEMARIAVESGITAICATPHCNLPGLYRNYDGEEYREIFWRIEKAIADAQIPLQLYPGMEVFATPDLPELLSDGRVRTLNGSRYLLVEFAFDENPAYIRRMLAKCSAYGILPVLAHAERYDCISKDPSLAYEFQTGGYLIQINKGSIEGSFGPDAQQTAHRLLRHGVVSVIASDAHGAFTRSPRMDRARVILETQYSKAYASILFDENPKRICANQATYRLKAKPFAD